MEKSVATTFIGKQYTTVISEITPDGRFAWYCPGTDEDEEDCNRLNEAHLDEALYQGARHARKPGRGAVIALPRCECGSQTFLKADYTLKELWRVVQPVQNEQGVIWAYVLPLRFVKNLRLHQALFDRGCADYAPILEKPPQELLTHPQMAQIGDVDVVHALWFGYLVARERIPQLAGNIVALLGGGT